MHPPLATENDKRSQRFQMNLCLESKILHDFLRTLRGMSGDLVRRNARYGDVNYKSNACGRSLEIEKEFLPLKVMADVLQQALD